MIKKAKTRADKCPCLCLSSRRENKQREEAFCGRLNRIITWPCRHLPAKWLQHIALHDCLYVANLVTNLLPALEGSCQLFGDVDLSLLGLQHGGGQVGSDGAVGAQAGSYFLPGGESAAGSQCMHNLC